MAREPERLYWHAKVIETVLGVAAFCIIMAPVVSEAVQREPLASTIYKLRTCEPCKRRREKVRSFMRTYEEAERKMQRSAERTVREAGDDGRT
jgi:hypothetical protein